MPARSHGMSRTRLYILWKNMKGRCYRKSSTHYHRYGGRGIKVCAEWKDSFETFMIFALENGYTDELTIDRINESGNYEPTNCQFISNEDNCKLMNAHHIKNKTGGHSDEKNLNVKNSNRANNGIPVIISKDAITYEFSSIGEAADFLSEFLNRARSSVYSHMKQVAQGKYETIAGWEVIKCKR